MMFLSHFDIFCDLLLNRHTATWNLLVNLLIEKQQKKEMMSSMRLSSNRPQVRTSESERIQHII